LLSVFRLIAATPGGARFLRPISYKLPLIGPILVGAVRLRFLSVLGSLWGAGVAPMEALETAARASDDSRLMRRIAAQLEPLSQGMPLGSALAATKYFPADVMHLISTGETSGSVPEMLQRVANYTRQDLNDKLKKLPLRLQLLLYAVMVPIVAYFVITTWQWVYEKMFEVTGG